MIFSPSNNSFPFGQILLPRWSCLWALLLAASSTALAQLPRTQLTTIFPPGGAKGTEVTVSISGAFTEAASGLVFSHPDISAEQQIDPPTEYRVAHRKQRRFKVRIAPHVPGGTYEVRAVGPTGLSNPRVFMVTGLDEQQFRPGDNRRDNPFDVAVGQVINARARADQRDYFRFTGRQGVSLLLQVWAERIDSQMDASLAIYASSGKRLARVVQGQTRDPILTFTPPADDQYLVEVFDITYRGGDEYPYRLEISRRAHVDVIFPPVADLAQETIFTVYGFNLPAGQPTSTPARYGNLQSLAIRFTPQEQDEVELAAALQRGDIASAAIEGRAIRMPTLLSRANPVFVAKSEAPVVNEQAANDTPDTAQEVKLPCEIAGQFFPQRDVDWFEFEAKKGQTYWIDLASQRVGATSDPTIRLRIKRTKPDGNIEYRDISTSDDLEGPPNSRSSRRFYSGSGDVSHRFRAPEDGRYQLAVRDLYNTTHDDPRLVYRLTVRTPKPDFQLVAFPNPARHADVKIVKPSGVSILPGGSEVIRVRVLPQHGFTGEVEVTAKGLPAGVSASPTVLSRRIPEGYLILSAEAAAAPTAGKVQIVGTARIGAQKRSRLASTGTIRRAVNNVDSAATSVRLTRDLLIAVVDSNPAPAAVRVQDAAVTSIGGKLKVPLRVARRAGFDAEIQLEGVEVPRGFKVDATKTKGDAAEIALSVQDAKLPVGNYTIPLTAKVKERRPRNRLQVQEAEADLQKITKLKHDRDAEIIKQQQIVAGSEASIRQTQQMVDGAQKRADMALTKLTDKLQAEQSAATRLAEKLASAAADASDETRYGGIDQAEAAIATLKQQRARLISELAAAREPLTRASEMLRQRQAVAVAAQAKLDTLRKKQDEADKQRQEAEKRLGQVKKAQLEQEHEFWIYSTPIQVNVRPTPVDVILDAPIHGVAPGGEASIPILVRRNFGFSGPVAVRLLLPQQSGIAPASLVLGPGQSAAKIPIKAHRDANQDVLDATIQTAVKFNGLDLTDQQSTRIEVIAKP